MKASQPCQNVVLCILFERLGLNYKQQHVFLRCLEVFGQKDSFKNCNTEIFKTNKNVGFVVLKKGEGPKCVCGYSIYSENLWEKWEL